jgi:hypothetical protein
MGFQEIGLFAKDLETMEVLHKIDRRLQKRFRSHFQARTGTTISSNIAVILLMKIKEYLGEGHTTIDDSPEVAFAILVTLMSTNGDARLDFNPKEVQVLNRLHLIRASGTQGNRLSEEI